MKIKVIIDEGIITSVLSDGMADVEIVDVDSNYEDYHSLRQYKAELMHDRDLHEIPFAVVKFGEEEAE